MTSLMHHMHHICRQISRFGLCITYGCAPISWVSTHLKPFKISYHIANYITTWYRKQQGNMVPWCWASTEYCMMTLSNGNIFRFTGHLCGEFTGHRWIPHRWRLKSPALRLFTQPFIQARIKENIKAPHHWPLCGEFTSGRWIVMLFTPTRSLWYLHH